MAIINARISPDTSPGMREIAQANQNKDVNHHLGQAGIHLAQLFLPENIAAVGLMSIIANNKPTGSDYASALKQDVKDVWQQPKQILDALKEALAAFKGGPRTW